MGAEPSPARGQRPCLAHAGAPTRAAEDTSPRPAGSSGTGRSTTVRAGLGDGDARRLTAPAGRSSSPLGAPSPRRGAGPGRAARFRHGQRLVGPSFPAGLGRQSSAWMFAGHGRRPSGRVLAAAPSRRFGLSASGPCHPVPVSGHRAWVTVRRFRSSRIVAFFQKTGVD